MIDVCDSHSGRIPLIGEVKNRAKCVAPLALDFVRVGNPWLTPWAKFCRASGADVALGRVMAFSRLFLRG
jgi:hypothetical protein